jgi:hypothetical protein
MGLLQKRAATVTETSARQSFFADATRAVAGLTPDDDSFIPAVFTLAEELSQLDGLNGDAEQGEMACQQSVVAVVEHLCSSHRVPHFSYRSSCVTTPVSILTLLPCIRHGVG